MGVHNGKRVPTVGYFIVYQVANLHILGYLCVLLNAKW